MGKRLTKIYTRTGDDGTTGLGDGSRLAKDSLRIEAIGAVDALNSHIGRVLAQGGMPEAVRDGELHEVKSPLILQPGPAALTDGLDALHALVARWARKTPSPRLAA